MKKHIAWIIALAMAFTAIAAIPAGENAFATDALKAPKLTNHAAGKTSVKNTWSKVKGADGYEIYRAIGNEKTLKRVKTIESGNTLTWTDKKAKKGKACYYAVRAYQFGQTHYTKNKKTYGAFSKEKMAIPTNQPNWVYTLNKKTKKTKTLKLTITNKGRHSMKIETAGVYLRDSTAFKAWNYRSMGDLRSVSSQKLRADGITSIKLKKTVTIKPGKTATLTYRASASVKYAKAGRIVSQFQSGGKTYGMWHSLKSGSMLWVVQ